MGTRSKGRFTIFGGIRSRADAETKAAMRTKFTRVKRMKATRFRKGICQSRCGEALP